MLDHPDWLKEVAGSLRYVGSFQVTEDGGGGGENSLAFAVTPLERAVIVMCPQLGAAATQEIQVFEGQPPYLVTQDVVLGPDAQIVIGYINPELSGSWVAEAIINGDTGYSGPYYVFTDTQLPLTMIANGPVPLKVNLVQADQHTGVVPVGIVGGDTPAPWYSAAQASGLNTQIILTFPAQAGHRWMASFVYANLRSTVGAAAFGDVYVWDGGTQIWQGNLIIPATAYSMAQIIAPGLALRGTVNTQMQIGFAGASGANVYQTVSAGVYLL